MFYYLFPSKCANYNYSLSCLHPPLPTLLIFFLVSGSFRHTPPSFVLSNHGVGKVWWEAWKHYLKRRKVQCVLFWPSTPDSLFSFNFPFLLTLRSLPLFAFPLSATGFNTKKPRTDSPGVSASTHSSVLADTGSEWHAGEEMWRGLTETTSSRENLVPIMPKSFHNKGQTLWNCHNLVFYCWAVMGSAVLCLSVCIWSVTCYSGFGFRVKLTLVPFI